MFGYSVGTKISDFINDWAFDPLVIMPIVLGSLFFIIDAYDPNTLSAGLAMLVALSPVWLPLYLGVFLWISWVDYIRFMFWFSQDVVLLEVQLPLEVYKSPLAMEAFLITLWNAGGETTFINRVWKGSFRPVWSLEIASNEGRIGFYIHIRSAWRNIVEARLYAQFPDAKVFEVDDYVSRIPFNLKDYDIYGTEYRKSKPQALPIKTYVDYGLDKDPKEEFKVDPISSILELFAQIGKGEHYWMQIILKARRHETEWYGFRSKKDQYKEGAAAEIKNIIANAAKRTADLVDDPIAAKQVASRGQTLLSESDKRRVDQIERSMSKLVFDTGVHVIYLAKKENYSGINVGAMIRFFDSYRGHDSSREYNGLGVSGGLVDFNYPWQDFMKIRETIAKENIFFHYKNRAYFYVPYDQTPVFLNTEELASLWHFPSSVIQTPGLNRVPSRSSEAPINLPTGL